MPVSTSPNYTLPAAAPVDPDQDPTPRLVERAQAGDRDAFGGLFDRHYDRLVRHARTRLGSQHAAEDVASSVFESLLTSIGSYDARRGPFLPWLLTVCNNRIIDGWRSAAHRLEFLSDEEAVVAGVYEDHATLVAQRAALAAALALLPASDRDVLLHRFYVGLSLDETAMVMGLTVKAVQHRQRRAIDKLLEGADLTDHCASGDGRATMNVRPGVPGPRPAGPSIGLRSVPWRADDETAGSARGT